MCPAWPLVGSLPNLERISGSVHFFKGSVSQDSLPIFFHDFEPIWSPDKQFKILSNAVSISPNYSIINFANSDSAVFMTPRNFLRHFVFSMYFAVSITTQTLQWHSHRGVSYKFESWKVRDRKSRDMLSLFFLFFGGGFLCPLGIFVQYFPVWASYPGPRTWPYEILIYRHSI